ncbi:Phenylalanine ammonia-lyase [Mycena chlorophos]|uniref:Phenylalanine ammonia-lyase n=1 Tax=Mycena chlorophos TaxID=658473 RepID=A0A8H6SVG5_MYCCL|nr:Phenylalanine ammonia-lyase [Mycena chlorophos]
MILPDTLLSGKGSLPTGLSTSSDPLTPPASSTVPSTKTLLRKFLDDQKEPDANRNIQITGETLSISAVAAVARHSDVPVYLSSDQKERVVKSRSVIADKVDKGSSIYGLSTGFGGSAVTRTGNAILLGHSLLQHQHIGILSSSQDAPRILPLLDPNSTAMPESWVRAAILVRINSLIRAHSGVRWELLEKLREVLQHNVIPVVPLRGSISASGDLSPLSYVAGLVGTHPLSTHPTLNSTSVGHPSIRAFVGPPAFGPRKIEPASTALAAAGIEPLALASKEHLGILNGTAFSTGVAALALNDAIHLTVLAQVCTAMCTEALVGSRGSYDAFIAVARPHPGQIECAQNIWNLLEGSSLAQNPHHEEEHTIQEDKYTLRQDRYPLRTAPQWLGPQIEDINAAYATITQECNSTTDNPLVCPETGHVHHGGNFQAMSVTNAMEKTRLALHHIAKLLFAQSTELLNPGMNRGLPPSLASTDPSLNYFAKGLDIATAAYVSELGHLASPVSTHVQSAEMHNQAVNSLALISARATLTALDVLTMLISTYLYILCQALDLRALQVEFIAALQKLVVEELRAALGSIAPADDAQAVFDAMQTALDRTTHMDAEDQMNEVASASSTPLLKLVAQGKFTATAVTSFQTTIARRGTDLLQTLRGDFLYGRRGPAPAHLLLGKTRPVYEFVRIQLGVKMHGLENYTAFENVADGTLGENITKIYEAIRDGEMARVVAGLFASVED